jgi:hypothetical protein
VGPRDDLDEAEIFPALPGLQPPTLESVAQRCTTELSRLQDKCLSNYIFSVFSDFFVELQDTRLQITNPTQESGRKVKRL